MSENNFSDKLHRNHIRTVFQCNGMTVNFEINYGLKSNEKFNVSLEQMGGKNLMQLRLSDLYDQTKVFVATVDNNLYEKIKVEQTLHVSFDGFVEHLAKILESCKNGELFMSLAKNDGKIYLQLYEKRSFRNLIHLFLPVSEASIETVLFHINQSMLALQEQVSFHANLAESLKVDLISKEERNISLRNEIKILQDALREQENHVFNRNLDELKQLQNALKNLSEAKDNEELRFKGIIQTMQEKIDSLNSDNYRLNEKLVSFDKENENRATEVKKLKTQVGYLKEQNEKLHADAESKTSRDRKHELNLIDLKRQINDSRDKINSLEKHKSDLIAELEAEKIVCQTKRNALQIATEEISKANSIIVKQSREIAELKRKSDLRAEVALKQESLLMEKDKVTSQIQKQYDQIEEQLQKYCQASGQFTQSILDMKDFSDKLESKYHKKIRELETDLSIISRNEGHNQNKNIPPRNPLRVNKNFNF